MFSEKHKIIKKEDFALIYKKGTLFQSNYLKVFILPNNLIYNRFSIIVPKTVSTKAVVRNKVKRRLKNILFNIDSSTTPPIDIIIKTFKGMETLDYNTLEERFENLFNKLNNTKF